MKRDYVIKKLIKAGSVQEAVKNEQRARLFEVYEMDKPTSSTSVIGFSIPVNEDPDPYFGKRK